MIAVEATKEAIWLNRLIMEMRLTQGVINFHYDSQSALHLDVNQVMDSRVKHINIIYHFIIQAVFDKTIELVKIDSKLNPVDALIKVILLESFRRYCDTMQVVHREHERYGFYLPLYIITLYSYGYGLILVNSCLIRNLVVAFRLELHAEKFYS